MPDAALKRRWFRFSLRTFLVAFTVVAVWLGWNVHLVQRRKDFIAKLQAPFLAIADPQPSSGPLPHQVMQKTRAIFAGEHVFTDRRPTNLATTGWPMLSYETREPTASAIPWIRQLLGDDSYWVVSYFPGPPIERACDLFPEATVMVAKAPWPWPEISASNERGGWQYRDANGRDMGWSKATLPRH